MGITITSEYCDKQDISDCGDLVIYYYYYVLDLSVSRFCQRYFSSDLMSAEQQHNLLAWWCGDGVK